MYSHNLPTIGGNHIRVQLFNEKLCRKRKYIDKLSQGMFPITLI